jgi:hypothetical protein
MLALVAALLVPGSASADVTHLDAAVRKALLTEHFRVVKHVAEIPAAVMTAAAQARGPKLSGYKLEMADPTEPFQVTDVIVTPGLPGRRLIAAYASDDYWVLHYEVGGIAHTFHFAVFSFRDGHARFVRQADVRYDVAGLGDLRKLLESNSSKIDDSYRDFY